MTQFYRLQPENNKYMYFELDAYDLLETLGGDFDITTFGENKKDIWKPVKGKFYSSENTSIIIPDITIWSTNLLILNQKAYAVLNEELNHLGEFLDVTVESTTYYLFNIMNQLNDDVIDNDKTELAMFKGQVVGLKSLGFNAETIDDKNLLFKIDFDKGVDLFCTEGFKSLIENAELTGLAYHKELAESPI